MTQSMTEPLSHQEGGNIRPAVERIAAFAAAARPEHLANDTRRLFKRNILDSLGCAIAALQGQPFQALREQLEEYRAPGRYTLIGGGKTSADQAALFNSGLVRYVDLLDSYMAPGDLCHLITVERLEIFRAQLLRRFVQPIRAHNVEASRLGQPRQ